MAYYIETELFDKISSVITKEHDSKYPKVAATAKNILNSVCLCKHDFKDDAVSISGTSEEYTYYDDEQCNAISDEIKKEFENVFGVTASVVFKCSGSHDQEPDPIPPLYWGGMETVWHYSLKISFKVN